ncbi:GRAM domain-containing protein 2B-like isoform X2 [Mytilus trossulus]|uniref:GRAM domain-containing protein 2B-like isoform X2 n=1 Tax=Mytilus trossulus TaxID=6551 RepID=UPI003003BA8A
MTYMNQDDLNFHGSFSCNDTQSPGRSWWTVMSKKDTHKETSPTRRNSRYEKFHKLFKSVPPEESPIDYFSCAFIGDILLQGHLYISQNFFCFHSKIRGRGRLLEIPMSRVISITREKTALIIPNAIGFQTAGKKYSFGSFLTRDSTYKFVIGHWKRCQEMSKTLLQNQSSGTESDVPYSLRDQTPDTPMDNSDITKMFDESQNNDVDNNNVINGHIISRPDTEDSDAGVCLACGSRDASDENVKNDISNNVNKTLQNHVLISQTSTVVHEKPKPVKPRFFIGSGKFVPYFFQCFDCEKMYEAFSQLSLKFQRIPRTNIILAICIIMTLFLIVSAMALTYKILLLQVRIDSKDIWSPSSKAQWREKMYSSIYGLQNQNHFSVVKQMNEILKSNLQVLEELSEDLKRLKSWGPERTKCEKGETECS